MAIPVRQLCAVVLAAAVLLVSATCTSAGCLLPMGPAKAQTPTANACCHHEKPAPAQAPTKDGCPLCQGSVLIAKGVEKSGASDLSPTLLCPAFYTVDPIASALSTFPLFSVECVERTPLGSPPTLLALHCALLT